MWLRLIVLLFKLGGVLFAVMALFALAGVVLDLPPAPGHPSFAMTLLILSVAAAALLLTGVLLGRRARAGGVLALFTMLYPLGFVVTGQRPLSWSDVIVTVVSLAVLLSIWPQLSSGHASTSAQ